MQTILPLETCRLQGEDNNSATELQLADELTKEIAFKLVQRHSTPAGSDTIGELFVFYKHVIPPGYKRPIIKT